MLTGGMSAKDRRLGFLLIKIGFILMLMPVAYFGIPVLAPKLGTWFMPKSLRDRTAEKAASKPADQAPPVEKPKEESWDPSKEPLPPGMKPAK